MSRMHRLFLLAVLLALAAAQQSSRATGKNEQPRNDVNPGPTDRAGDPLPAGARARLGTLRLRHLGAVSQLAFTTDGRKLASLARDNFFRLWDAGTGKELGHYQKEALQPQAPEGGQVSQFVVFNGAGGIRHRAIVEGGPTRGAVFAANGKLLATRADANTLVLTDLATGKDVRRITLKKAPVLAFALSPNSKVLAVSDYTGVVHYLDTATGKLLRQTPPSKELPTHLVFSPDGGFLAGITGADVRLWYTANGKRIRKYEGHENQITSLAFSADGRKLATASQDSTIRLWETDSEEELAKITIPETPVWSVAFSPDGKSLATGSNDNLVRLWDTTTGKEIRKFAGHLGPVHTVAFSPDGKALASATDDGSIRVWQTATGKERMPLRRPGKVVSVVIAANGRTVALGTDKGRVTRWDGRGGKLLAQGPPPPEGPNPVPAFAPDGKTVALADQQTGSIRLWDTGQGKLLRKLDGHQGTINVLAFAPDGTLLASAGSDLTIRLWKVDTGKELLQLASPHVNQRDEVAVQMAQFRGVYTVNALTFSADGKTLATAGSDNQVRLWETASGKERFHFAVNQSGVNVLVFSPDSKRLATTGNDETIRFWDLRSGKLRRAAVGHQGTINALAFTPNGKQLASAGEDRTVRLWDPVSGAELRRFEGHRGPVLSLAFPADGKTLVSGSADTTALVWDMAVPKGVRAAAADPMTARLARHWVELGSEDGQVTYRALIEMAGSPKEVVPFLHKRLRPEPAADSRRVALLIAELEERRYTVRSRAHHYLEQLRKQAEPAVRRALAGQGSLESKNRLKLLLKKIEGPPTSAAEWRKLRAVELLERIGTPEARRLLTDLAAGAPAAEMTLAAKASLKRLANRR